MGDAGPNSRLAHVDELVYGADLSLGSFFINALQRLPCLIGGGGGENSHSRAGSTGGIRQVECEK